MCMYVYMCSCMRRKDDDEDDANKRNGDEEEADACRQTVLFWPCA